MTGYIIGLVLGVIVFLLQNFKPTSLWFRILFLILTIAFFWGMSYVNAGYWNIFIIPIGVFVLCFIAALCFPLNATDAPKTNNKNYFQRDEGNESVNQTKEEKARNDYMSINGRNYYAELHDEDKIGRIDAPGFKQTYDRIIVAVITQITSTEDDLLKFGNLLYSQNFYPLSIHTKKEVMEHIKSVITEVSNTSKYGSSIQTSAEKNIDLLFNVYVSVMSIHEEATRQIEEIKSKMS